MSDKKHIQSADISNPRRGRRRWSSDEKIRILEEHKQSGLSASAYMNEMNLPKGSIYAWRKLFQKKNPKEQSTTGFLPVSLKDESSKQPAKNLGDVPPILMQVSETLSLKIPAGFVEEHLSAILNVLERRSC